MNKAFKYRIYPSEEQKIIIAKTCGSVRFVYNHFLALRQTIYSEKGESLSCYDCIKMLPSFKKEHSFLTEVDSISLQQSLKHLDAAYKNFFRDSKVGFPNFKSKHRSRKSYSTNVVNNNIRIEGKYVILPKLGKVKIKLHRTVPSDYVLKSATVSVTSARKYYVSLLYEYESQVSPVTVTKALGLDYSSPHLYIDSEGREPDFEKPFRKYQKKLAKEQRILSKMKEANKGRSLSECKNYQKQKLKVAKIHEKISNCRKDFLHKMSFELVENYDLIGVEDLNMRAMSQCLTLGKSTMDNGYGMFLNFLEYKLSDRGKHLIKVDKWYPSTKTCSCCGNTIPMRLSDREYVCPECGLVTDRDHNAAINICNEAIRTAGQAGIACLCSIR